MVNDIRIEEFDYNLPDERIPRHPLSKRDACKLLQLRPDGVISHRVFSELPALLPPGTLLVCNDTRVINARITFHKQTGSRIEVFLLEPIEPSDYVLTFQTRGRCVWNCLVGNLKRWKSGHLTLKVQPKGFNQPFTLSANRLHPTEGNGQAIEFTWNNPEATFADVVEAAGFIPIPPYLKRDSEESDLSDYQTVYADVKGSVAAPTAGLHFTPEVFSDLAAHNIRTTKLTLHVGAGTFQPVKADYIADHPMHTETFTVSRELISQLISQKRDDEPVAAVGTTSVRTLESLPVLGARLMKGDKSMHVGQWTAYGPELSAISTVDALEAIRRYMDENGMDDLTASTAIMIAPGFNWRIVDVMVTNFHQPQSTLLLLVSSFIGGLDYDSAAPEWRRVYDEAMANGYRFLSYGDACLFFRNPQGNLIFPQKPQSSELNKPIDLPASKSIGARFLAASYFADTLQECPAFRDCDDLRVIQRALLRLDSVRKNVGKSHPDANDQVYDKLDIHASGTAFRFMAAIAASTPGTKVLLTGTPRLCSRPMAPLLDVLRQAGASIDSLGENGTGPYHIKGTTLTGGNFSIRGDVSSQFISALMLASPTWKGGMDLRFTTPLVSRPYAEMTARVMRDFGIDVELSGNGVRVKEGKYKAPAGYRVEADWSAAGFIYEAATLRKEPIEIDGLVSPEESMQGDAATAGIFALLGVTSDFTETGAVIQATAPMPQELNLDMTHNPDLVPALMTACALNDCRFRLTGVKNLRLKESDRLAVMQAELKKLGYVINAGEDNIEWQGMREAPEENPLIATYDDHRIAMAFAMAALTTGKIRISNPDVVEKSFLRFWDELPKLGLVCRREGNIMTVKKGTI